MRSVAVIISCLTLAGVAVAVSSHRLLSAQGRFDAAHLALLSLQADAADVLQFRSLRQRAAERKRPEQDMIARVHAVLQQANLPVQSHFQSLRLESDGPVGGLSGSTSGAISGATSGGYRQQSVAVSLTKLSIEQIGAFLLTWREDQPLWSPSRIELVHSRGDGRGRERKDFDRYDLAVTFSAVYVAEDGST